MSFSELGLSDKVVAAVTAAGYSTPTPIQAQAIPHVLKGRDVLGIAQTGTGKTAAFVLPMITKLQNGRARARMPRTLILEPTRELAAQVAEQFTKYSGGQKLSVALLIGGVSFDDQDMKITRGVDVLIATPGRLLDHFERGRLLLTGVELLVIDEADRMLDMGFIPDIERIGKLVPFTRQTLFFTATMPKEIQHIADTFLHNPERVEVSRPATAAATITQGVVKSSSDPAAKRDILRRLLRADENFKNAIIFCNRKRDVALLHRSLVSHGFNAVPLHGDMEQPARMAALDQFRKGEAKLLIASDVAARGLDIPAVSHVFNFDVPYHPDDYVHRIGRTGRAGLTGTAITIVTGGDAKSIAAIEKLTTQPINVMEAPEGAAPINADEESQSVRRGRGRSGGRGRGGRQEGRPERSQEARSQEPRSPEPRQESAEHERPARAERPARNPERERPAKVADIGEARSRRKPSRQKDDQDGGDMSHLPAFLLRPVRVKA
ncbi:ATP-dependent RNA helicase RhlE [Variibacter gotjawalensis]|uniref:DEAD-box ATP-dependent RNA helicase RhpA n=1 Tax=Variibacter gotjawalensis TaxID=1333996 RepID=A0A0S3PY19_9BRAD|nr:DEAD/DEAH box helicase [Variibacter gotjawalensis]NIK46672.1 superfamily II DNA/RNA helicase [Variibacter gotjawalensis]RZS48575.1 superfamily II DNA/RNA helicase [Variibacter gotjawalensis]BAT60837.1 ATP-dependent RNA helicase RhlE [Variibacter gotjawalensis]